jgi:hypothetical protein
MLILLTIVVVLTALAAFSIFVNRRNSKLLEYNSHKNLAAETFRPLFQPTEEDIRGFELAEKAEIEALKAKEARRILDEKAKNLSEFSIAWNNSPDRKTTSELLLMASQSKSAKKFSEISNNVIKVLRENRIENLSARELAELLDSLFRTLPQQERTSGEIFWLREEIKNLNSVSEVWAGEIKKSSELSTK